MAATATADAAALKAVHETWPLCIMPQSWRPYGEVIRLHRPAGILIFYYPFLFGAFLASIMSDSKASLTRIGAVNVVLFVETFLMRAVLCAWNDILDQDFDRQVARTRLRPLARRAITNRQTFTLIALLTLVIWGVTQYFFTVPMSTIVPLLMFHTIYPAMKRVTNLPQLILGLAFGAQVLPAFYILDSSYRPYEWPSSSTDRRMIAGACMVGIVALWTLIFDTIYAAQDVRDDKKAGIKSTMVSYENHAQSFLRGLAVAQLIVLLVLGKILQPISACGGILFYMFSCAGTAITLGAMVEFVDLRSPASCAWWFGSGNNWVAASIAGGLIGEVFFLKRLS